MQINLQQSLSNVGEECVRLMTKNGLMVKAASEQSPLQKAYREFFMRKIGESQFSKHPFEGTDEEAAAFFREVSREWKKEREKFESDQTEEA